MGAALAVGLPLTLTTAPGSSARLRRMVVQRAAVLPAGDHPRAALDAWTRVRGAVVLRPRDEAALSRFIARASDPDSPAYDRFLAPGAYAARFGPTASTRRAVVAALRAQGLRVAAPTSDGLILAFSGTTSDVERAFATRLRAVSEPDGDRGTATSAPVSLPSAIAPSVAAVVGLDDTVPAHRIASPITASSGGGGVATARARAPRVRGAHAAAHADAGTSGPHACPAATAAALRDNGLTDDALAGAYGASGLYAEGDVGAGQHIAVYELEPFLRSDVRTFDTCYFGAGAAAAMMRRLHVVDVDGGPPHGAGEGEASLDVEDLSAFAPGATIDVYAGPAATAFDSLDEYATIVDRDRDRIVSTSWGECEQGVQQGQPGEQTAENLLFQQAAAQGETVFAAAGDEGSDDCSAQGGSGPAAGQDPVSVDDPASQPDVVGVGGTALTDAEPGHLVEQAWNDGATYGAGGGGISMSWTMSSWQRAARVPGIARPGDATYRAANALSEEAGYAGGFCDTSTEVAAGAPCRLVPDVSAQADEFTGAATVYSRADITSRDPTGWSTTGGTSSAAPIWAASLALIDASPACAASTTTRAGVGFAAPLLYAVASDRAADAASFTDVRTGDNDIYGLDGGRVFSAGPGYDLTTGLGSPILSSPDGGVGLATSLCTLAPVRARPAVTGLSPQSGPGRGGGRLTIHGDGFRSGGDARVVAVQIGTHRVPASRLRVRGPHTITLSLPSAARARPPASGSAPGGAAGAGPADVVVTLADGRSSAPGPRTVFHYLDTRSATPTVEAVSPAGGLSSGGTRVTLLGSGFSRATTVLVGGVPARRLRVVSGSRLRFTVAPRSPRTRCVALPHRDPYRGETTEDDICQTYVRVQTAHARSATSRIRAPAEGAQHLDAEGIVSTPPDCGCESAPAPDEFDYVPRPRISSVSTADGPLDLADEHGGTIVTVRGAGLDPLTLDYASFGDPRLYSSESDGVVYATGTELQIRAPRRAVTPGPVSVPLSVRSLGGRSRIRAATYAGVPTISAVANPADARTIDGVSGGPATGGTALDVSGRGLGSQVLGIQFVQAHGAPYSIGTQYLFADGHGGRRLRTRTVAENPAVVDVQACTVSGCTPPGTGDRFWLYAAGTPTVDAISPASGPASGATVTTILGQNLGCPLSVSFGAAPASSFDAIPTLLPCGSSQELTATAPAGTPGTSVPVTVQTAESYYTGSQPVSAAAFTYR